MFKGVAHECNLLEGVMCRKGRALMFEGHHRGNEKRTSIFNELRRWGLGMLDNGRTKSRARFLHE